MFIFMGIVNFFKMDGALGACTARFATKMVRQTAYAAVDKSKSNRVDVHHTSKSARFRTSKTKF
jgi:hypothetical protein